MDVEASSRASAALRHLKRVYLSMGSNRGDRVANFERAMEELGRNGVNVERVSSFYKTEPVDFGPQAWFLNCAVALATIHTPQHLMAAMLTIEHEMGRRRTQKKGPRTIDIDILLFGGLILDSQELTIPHPAMHQRRFVLEPLAEIAPEVRHPVLQKSVWELLKELPAGQLVQKFEGK